MSSHENFFLVIQILTTRYNNGNLEVSEHKGMKTSPLENRVTCEASFWHQSVKAKEI